MRPLAPINAPARRAMPTLSDALMVVVPCAAPRGARVLTDETLCEAEAGPGRPPVELFATLGVRQICVHPGWD
jgi:hypothetical protein